MRLAEPIIDAATEVDEMPTEEKETPDIFPSAVDPTIEPAAEFAPGDSGDRVTAETDIEKNVESAVTDAKDVPETVTEPEPEVEPEYKPDPVIVPNEPAVDTASPSDEAGVEQQVSNAPIFIDPCQGGPNPFFDDMPTEIDEHNSNEFIGDGERPGEGIHF